MYMYIATVLVLIPVSMFILEGKKTSKEVSFSYAYFLAVASVGIFSFMMAINLIQVRAVHWKIP